MQRMKLHGMASAFRESLPSTFAESMTPDNFVSWLLSNEWDYRVNATIERLIRQAGFRYKAFPEDIDYSQINSLRKEAVQKLTLYQPLSIGQASRISGVSPADISVLLVYLEQKRRRNILIDDTNMF